MTAALVDIFCRSFPAPPAAITLDIDDTCDAVHGNQQLSLFNAHYDRRCFLPVHVYHVESGKPVAVLLRPGKTPSGPEVRTLLKHLVRRIRRHWPRTRIVFRGDSHYGRPQAMAWCEENGVDYIFGLAGNSVLHTKRCSPRSGASAITAAGRSCAPSSSSSAPSSATTRRAPPGSSTCAASATACHGPARRRSPELRRPDRWPRPVRQPAQPPSGQHERPLRAERLRFDVRPGAISGRTSRRTFNVYANFVRMTTRCGEGPPNAAEFLDSSRHPRKRAWCPSSCRKRLRSNSRPRLAFHEVLLLDVGPRGTITVVDEFLIRPPAETGPVPLVNPCFIFIRQDSRNSCRGAKSPSYSICYGSAQTADPYPVFVPEPGECKLLTTTGPS